MLYGSVTADCLHAKVMLLIILFNLTFSTPKNSTGPTQAAVDELLLEVLEHLPQTVRGFEGEMKACSAVFEPETVISSYKGMMGPLSVALQKRQQMETYCTIPLVLDFMSRKFTKGLPSLRDSERVLENDKELSNAGQTLYGKSRVVPTVFAAWHSSKAFVPVPPPFV